jgi:CRISPR/Cas system-associated exonuclease Cas4 (RecB family)
MGLKDVMATYKHPRNQISGAVERYLLGFNHVEKDRRKYCYHPSSLGKCPRKVQFEFLDLPKDSFIKATTWFIFQVGHSLQEVYVQFMIGAGICKREDIERPMSNVEYNVHGHTDMYSPEHKYGCDIKTSKDPIIMYQEGKRVESAFKDLPAPHPEYITQCHAYMLCEPEATHYQILYINKNDQTTKEFNIPRDEAKLDELKEVIRGIDLANKERRLVDRPEAYSPNKPPCSWCDYKKTCYNDAAKIDWQVMDDLEAGKIDITTGKRLDGEKDAMDV